MPQPLGNRTEDSVINFKWPSQGADGASITRGTNGTVSVYKADDTTQSTAGVTDTEDFDTTTGVHHCKIDTGADAFYEVGKDYQVVLTGAAIDTKTVNTVLASFTIEYGFAEVDVVKWLGQAVATPTVNGVPEVDITHVGGAATTATLDTIKAQTAAIETDTQDIQSRIPAALTGDGNIKADTLRVGGTLQTAGDIMADTNDIQTRLPAALTAGGNMKSDTLAVDGSTSAATHLKNHSLTAVPVTFDNGGDTTHAIFANVDGAAASSDNDVYNGRILIFTAPAGSKHVATDITDYDGATKTATITAVPASVDATFTAILV